MRFIFSLILLCLYTARVYSWDLLQKKDGIEVYSEKVEGKKFTRVKGLMTIPGSIPAVLELWGDIPTYVYWMFLCKESQVLEHMDAFNQYIYVRTDAPIPMRDRDNVFFSTVDIQNNKLVEIRLHGVPDFVPVTKLNTRVPDSDGKIILRETSPGQVDIELTMYWDPGGEVPAFIINAFAIDFPYSTLSKFRNYFTEKQYSGKSLVHLFR